VIISITREKIFSVKFHMQHNNKLVKNLKYPGVQKKLITKLSFLISGSYSSVMYSPEPSTTNNASSMSFQPALSQQTSSQLNCLATDLSEMALADRPPPRKIRRRNALTVQDAHYPITLPPPNSPIHDAFEDSSRLQALDEIIHRDFSYEDGEPNTYCGPYVPKRKLPGKRRLIQGPKLPGEDREVSQILLHKDLEQYRPEGCLPEILIRKYAKALKSTMNPCSALVPYLPPEQILNEILSKEVINSRTSSSTEDEDVMDLDD
jgi:hypothetical protein